MRLERRGEVGVSRGIALGKRVEGEGGVEPDSGDVGGETDVHVAKVDLFRLAVLADLDLERPVGAVRLPLRLVRRDLDLALGARDDPAEADAVDGRLGPAVSDGGHGAALEATLHEDVVRDVLRLRRVDDLAVL